MTLEEKLLFEYKEAMKAKDSAKSLAISFLRSEVKNFAIEQKKEKLGDDDVQAVIKRQVKRLKESIEQFKLGKRQDLVDKESKNLEILESFLPKQLTEAELKLIVDAVVKTRVAVEAKDMGAVIKEVMAKAQGAADGKMVSDLVKQRIASAKPS